MTDTSVDPSFGLHAIDQISFAVTSIDDALPRYTAMFGGPFVAIDVTSLDVIIDGRTERVDLRLGFGRTGNIEVELVEVVAGRWPTVQWLREHGEGLHHLRYPVADVKASKASMLASGFKLTMQNAEEQPTFAYLTAPPLNGMTIELIQQ